MAILWKKRNREYDIKQYRIIECEAVGLFATAFFYYILPRKHFIFMGKELLNKDKRERHE